ncbi:MAG: hypothetical protein E6G59_10430 [Actinobacteria bacterium]|nr:MAG: hypothetical protein E6G59_10430 [Actinomycetota bacterium]
MKKDVSELGTILGVWAHPDDEAYLSAALMAWARRNGQRVVVVTATKGEAGTWDEERWSTVAMVRPFIEDVQPKTVITFGPDGMTGHDDHKAVSAWTTEAFRRAAPTGSTLYYATQTKAFADRWVDYLNRFNVFAPGTPPITPDDELAIRIDIPPDLLELKVKAVMAHDSQIEGMTSVFGADWIRQSQSGEYFRLADEMA